MKGITTREQYDALTRDKIIGKEDCPFCTHSLSERQQIWKGKYWYVMRNLYSYSGDDDHLMAIPYIHKSFAHELTRDEYLELELVQLFMKEYFGEKQYFSCTRETMSNRSIEHYHMHFIPGKLQGKYLRKMLENQGFPIHEELPM